MSEALNAAERIIYGATDLAPAPARRVAEEVLEELRKARDKCPVCGQRKTPLPAKIIAVTTLFLLAALVLSVAAWAVVAVWRHI